MGSRAELQRRLASEFAAQGWPYEHDLGPGLLDSVVDGGATDGQALVRQLPADYLDRHGITRGQMADVLERALGGQSVESEVTSPTSVVITDNRYAINIGDHARVSDSQLNTAGSQLVIQADTSKVDVLAAISVLVRGGLTGDWNEAAAINLGQVIDARQDISIGDVREIAKHAVETDKADSGRIKALVTKISTGAITGALSTGIIAALGALF